jgi:hypothetical protein
MLSDNGVSAIKALYAIDIKNNTNLAQHLRPFNHHGRLYGLNKTCKYAARIFIDVTACWKNTALKR